MQPTYWPGAESEQDDAETRARWYPMEFWDGKMVMVLRRSSSSLLVPILSSVVLDSSSEGEQ